MGSSEQDPVSGLLDYAPTPMFNRELSWLAFNRRVMALAADESLPLLERMKFVAIWASNLDEFFQVRVAGLKADLDDGGRQSPDGLSTTEQLIAVRDEAMSQYREVGAIYKRLRKALGLEGITILKWAKLTQDEQKLLTAEFAERVFPVLTPLAVDPGHPFPYISTLSLSIGVILKDPVTDEEHFARIKVPVELLGRYMQVPGSSTLVPLEQVIGNNIDDLFPGMEVLEWAAFRVTRDAALELEERDATDLMTAVETQLKHRRFGNVVRLELFAKASTHIRELLTEELGISANDVYAARGLIDLASGANITVSDRPDLHYTHTEPAVPAILGGEDGPRDLFAVLRQRDILVHHPYVSFDASVLELLRQASLDPAVQAIKMTLYRTAGDGRVVDALRRAAEAGKQVAVVVELKARFDERNNIEWARTLEQSGVHVTYGLLGLKVHAKTMLIVRQEGETIRRYCHVGTGNYNPKTARHYTDLGLMTANPKMGQDLGLFFNSLTGYAKAPDYEALIVAPHTLRQRLVDLVRHERSHGVNGRIIAKMNSLVDPEMITELYAASQDGVQIDLIVRGMCALVPGLAGVSENIRVRSILGRYLEHPRAYRFSHGATLFQDRPGELLASPETDGPESPVILIGSADLMPRNLDRRVEVLAPLLEETLRSEVERVLALNLASDRFTWELDAEGVWNPVTDGGRCDSQTQLQQVSFLGVASDPSPSS